MSSPRPQLTVASIGVSPLPINVTLISDTKPEYRKNGGDLQEGDRWYDTANHDDYLFINGKWEVVHTSEFSDETVVLLADDPFPHGNPLSK